ncbi:MAG: hypothetical protein CM15mP121_0540 [Bacteroidota bacterium]|nr:MAG: hypothetical protein CM15mP121_0540 [Bacteroidota bacterium]
MIRKSNFIFIREKQLITEKLLDLLIHNKRVAIISDIASCFIQLYNKNNNIKEAIVITASQLIKI